MKRSLIISMLIMAVGCAPKILTRGSPEQQKNLAGVMRLIGRNTYAHACPVDGLVLSAAHVVQRRDKLRPELPWPEYYAWSDQHGSSGYLQSFAIFPRDLGGFYVLSGVPSFYRHAAMEPDPGDLVHWLEWDLRGRDEAFAPLKMQSRVQRSVSGHVILHDPPTRGGSGSCVLNEKDEVVAIITWGVRVGTRDSVGVVVSVAGQWWPGGKF